LDEVPDEDEGWFCPACAQSRIEAGPAPPPCKKGFIAQENLTKCALSSGQFATVAIQATTNLVDSDCQTDLVPTPPSLSEPEEHLALPTQPETVDEPRRRLLSPFAPRLQPISKLWVDTSDDSPLGRTGLDSPTSTLTPLSTVATGTPNTSEASGEWFLTDHPDYKLTSVT
jgi:hypothetical protein